MEYTPFLWKPGEIGGTLVSAERLNVIEKGLGDISDESTSGRLSQEALNATFVTFKNFNGSAVIGKNVVITLTADGTDIQDITVEAL